MAHASSVLLSNGINTSPVRPPVKSGDMIGLNQTSGPPNACTFSVPGDSVLTRSGDLADGSSGVFSAQNDVRLNLSAVVIPDNHFTLAGITRDRRQGTAQLTATTTNPGLVTMSGRGLRKRKAKSLAVAGPVTFQLTPTGSDGAPPGAQRRGDGLAHRHLLPDGRRPEQPVDSPQAP